MKVQALKNFRVNLRSVIETSGLSQHDFSDTADVATAFLNRILVGKASPSLEKSDQLAQAAGYQLWQLLLPPAQFSKKFLAGPAKVA